MVKGKSILARIFVLIAMSLAYSTHATYAAGYEPYKVDMSRTRPDKPIQKSSIMAEVNRRWPGKILHISSDRRGGEDCHIVKSMGRDGEFRIIRVACRN